MSIAERRRIVDAAGVLRPGEWTGYGDISEVVYGHSGAGPAVGAVMPRSECAVFAHRVLRTSGEISPGWRDGDGRGSQECARRLRAEGVEVDAALVAHRRHHVAAEELRRRLT